MDRGYQNEIITEIQTPETPPYIIEYAGLVPMLQLSEARKRNIPGALEARDFTELLEQRDERAREEIICEVGSGFDDALLNFITVALVARRQKIIILAEASEGIDGFLPWQPKLEQHLQGCKERGILTTQSVGVEVERFTALAQDDQVVELLTEEAKALAA